MKNAFIRITEENNTKEGIVKYSLNDIDKMVKRFLKENYVDGIAYMIKHGNKYVINGDKILDDIKPHYHVVISSEYDISFIQLKKYFPYGDIQECRDLLHSIRYLTHIGYGNKQDKYKFGDVKSYLSFNGKVENGLSFIQDFE